MNPAPRKFHRVIAPWLVLPLVVTLATGLTYRLGRAWFGMDKKTGGTIMDIHSGEWLGDLGSVIYVIVVGLGLLLLLATGLYLVLKSRGKGQPRVFHRVLGAVFLLPLAFSALTGVVFKVGEQWFHLDDDTLDFLMTIHEGGWLGPTLKPFYVLAIALGLLFLSISGLQLTGLFKKRTKSAGS